VVWQPFVSDQTGNWKWSVDCCHGAVIFGFQFSHKSEYH